MDPRVFGVWLKGNINPKKWQICKMAKHYTVLFIDDKGSPVRETRISKRLIWFAALIAAIGISSIGLGVYKYAEVRQVAGQSISLMDKLDQQQAIIEEQRGQIKSFAQNINTLKSSVISLNDFEQKIRIMANLEHKPDRASLFAIGGSMPEDLEADMPLNQDHDRLIREMHNHMEQVEQATAVQQSSFEMLLRSLESKRNVLAATPSLRPTKGWISSDFGYRISPFTGRKEMHRGLDIANHRGTPIIAPADGTVTYAGKKWLMGNMLTLDHGYGMVTRYGHLDKMLKKKGERVSRGDIIATVGNTGRSTGPHLHYEVRLNGVPVNPMKYILD
jgi:murein DD-endopeptidase MepM/ murein hydrolase activator NlpD